MSIGTSIAAMVTAPFRKAKRRSEGAMVNAMHSAHDRLQDAKSILSEIGADLLSAESEAAVIAAFRRRETARAAAVAAQRDLTAIQLEYDAGCQRCDIGGPASLPGRF